MLQHIPAAASKGLHLQQIFDSRSLSEILDSAPELVESLMSLLPEIDRTPHGLKSFLSSPQFQQAIGAFDAALRGGHKEEILRQLGCAPSDAVADSTMIGSFFKTLEKKGKK